MNFIITKFLNINRSHLYNVNRYADRVDPFFLLCYPSLLVCCCCCCCCCCCYYRIVSEHSTHVNRQMVPRELFFPPLTHLLHSTKITYLVWESISMNTNNPPPILNWVCSINHYYFVTYLLFINLRLLRFCVWLSGGFFCVYS